MLGRNNSLLFVYIFIRLTTVSLLYIKLVILLPCLMTSFIDFIWPISSSIKSMQCNAQHMVTKHKCFLFFIRYFITTFILDSLSITICIILLLQLHTPCYPSWKRQRPSFCFVLVDITIVYHVSMTIHYMKLMIGHFSMYFIHHTWLHTHIVRTRAFILKIVIFIIIYPRIS
mgnify:CR=1 FL=1